MTTLQTIEDTVEQLAYIQTIVETYESVAASYMRRTKQSIVDSRAFYDGIHTIYDEVLETHQKDIADALYKRPLHKRVWQKLTSGVQKQKEASILLSANTGLYGDIVQKTFFAFMKHVSSTKSDIIIAGKRGKLLFDEHMPRTRYTYFDMPDTTIDTEHIFAITNKLSSYQRVHVFYGKFVSFVTQTPTDTLLGGSPQVPATTKSSLREVPAVLYLFEPSLKEVVQFFETEIFASLFQQLAQESRLAKLAARMYQLDAASEGIQNTLTTATLERQKLVHQLENKKQLETVHSRIAMGL